MWFNGVIGGNSEIYIVIHTRISIPLYVCIELFDFCRRRDDSDGKVVGWPCMCKAHGFHRVRGPEFNTRPGRTEILNLNGVLLPAHGGARDFSFKSPKHYIYICIYIYTDYHYLYLHLYLSLYGQLWPQHTLQWRHMGTIASQITSLTIVYSTVYSDADQRKYQSSASLAFVRGIHRRPVNSPHKWPVTRQMFPFDDVIVNVTTPVWPASKEADLADIRLAMIWHLLCSTLSYNVMFW